MIVGEGEQEREEKVREVIFMILFLFLSIK
jgi:hypothetical protein